MTTTPPDDRIAELLEHARAAVAACTTDAEARQVAMELTARAREWKAAQWAPYPWQHPHHHDRIVDPTTGRHKVPLCTPDCYTRPPVPITTHGTWLQLGGRGTGKTEGAARYVNDHALGPPCDPRLPGGHRILIIAPTQGDAAEACMTGPSGLMTINPRVRMVGGVGGLTARWPNRARARLLGAHTPDDIERLRAAGNTCLVWLEELAAQRRLREALEHSLLGLRIGPNPHYVGSTTPKPRPDVKAVIDDPKTVVTRGRTEDAVHLEPAVRQSYLDKHAGTRLGRQELGGEVLDDVEGALWVHDARLVDDPNDDRPGVEDDRVPVAAVGWTSHTPDAPAPVAAQLAHRVVVAVDPSGGGDDEAGIVVVGAVGNHGYVLADLSGHMTSDRWARRAVQAWRDYGAEGIALEKSGGAGADSIVLTIRSITLDDGTQGTSVPIFHVPTKVGKRLRAEPVSALYQQHRVHHVGAFDELEDQMTSWVPDETADSPDRVDALVHGLTYLLLRTAGARSTSVASRRVQR